MSARDEVLARAGASVLRLERWARYEGAVLGVALIGLGLLKPGPQVKRARGIALVMMDAHLASHVQRAQLRDGRG